MMKIKKGKAVMMILLVLSLPLYSASVFASLTNAKVQGVDNLEGILRPNERPRVDVIASIPSDTITTNQITLGDLIDGPFFDTCEDRGNENFLCSVEAPASVITSNPFSIEIKLHNDDLTLDSQTNLNGVVDEIPPQVNQFEILPARTKGGNINIIYSLRDFAHDLGVTSKCSGIKQLTFASTQAGIFQSKNVSGSPSNCLEEGQIQIPIESIAAQDGIVSIILTAKDNVENQEVYEATVDFDRLAPTITPNSLAIQDQQGNELGFLASAPVIADVVFTIVADDLVTNSVTADITSLHLNPPAGFDSKQAACTPTQTQDEFDCRIENVPVQIDVSKTVSVIVTAADDLGNVGSSTLNKNLQHDDAGPAINTLRTTFFDSNGNKNYGGVKFNITVSFLEIGAGIDDNDLLLDLSNIQSGLSSVGPTSCKAISSGNERACTWADIRPDKNDGLRTVSILSSVADKLGNAVQGPLSHNITLDKTLPGIISKGIAPKAVASDTLFPSVLKTGDAFIISAQLRETNNIIQAIADFSAVSTTQTKVSGICTAASGDPGKKTCSFSGDPINVPGHLTGAIPLSFMDSAGNIRNTELAFEVLENKNFTGIHHWVPKTECAPDLIDRQLAPLVNINAYCKVNLAPTTADQDTLKLTLLRDQCSALPDTTSLAIGREFGESGTSTERSALDFVEDIEILNTEAGSTQPFLKIRLAKDDMNIDTIRFACPIEIFSRVGDSVTKTPEVVNATVELVFHNNPLSTFGEAIEKEIKDAKDAANNIAFKMVGFLKKIMRYAEILCNALATIQKISLFFKLRTEALTLAHIAMAGSPTEKILAAQKTESCVNDKGLELVKKKQYVFLDKYCKILNCQTSPEAPTESSNKDGNIAGIRKSLGKWQFSNNKLLGGVAGGGGATSEIAQLGLGRLRKGGQASGFGTAGSIEDVTGKQPYQYMNAKDNLLVALTLGCIPGIINGVENIRQIFCKYADCLESNAFSNVPPKACKDDQKYMLCKYVVGEMFAIIPHTAFIFHYWGAIQSAFSDPFSAVFTTLNFMFDLCPVHCSPDVPSSVAWAKENSVLCSGLQFASMLGEIINGVDGVITSWKEEKIDYCERLDDGDDGGSESDS